jgi:aspartyl/asparaginyl-tRNA synthetase
VTENSNTSRHLSEFWMIEPEIAFADLADNTTLAEGLLKYTFAALLKASATRSPSREPRKRAVLKRRSVSQAERGLVHEL